MPGTSTSSIHMGTIVPVTHQSCYVSRGHRPVRYIWELSCRLHIKAVMLAGDIDQFGTYGNYRAGYTSKLLC
ncbi:hypothetical protein J6590_086046 [Homalodisca vitripennis]|nr:hypothetical protein J6590_086046 [Homalodisca vitripennis]